MVFYKRLAKKTGTKICLLYAKWRDSVAKLHLLSTQVRNWHCLRTKVSTDSGIFNSICNFFSDRSLHRLKTSRNQPFHYTPSRLTISFYPFHGRATIVSRRIPAKRAGGRTSGREKGRPSVLQKRQGVCLALLGISAGIAGR